MPSASGGIAECSIRVGSSPCIFVATRRLPGIGKNQMVRNHGLHQGIPPERGARCAQTQRCPSIGSQYGSSGGSETLVSPTNPLGFLLLMGILRAVHAHQDLPCEPILRALTHVLLRGKYQLPSVSSPLSLWSIPLIVAIVSMSEPGDIDGKPLVRSLRPAKTVSFELPEVTPPPPRSPPSMHRLPPPPPCRTPLRQPRLLLRLPPSSPHCHFPQPPPHQRYLLVALPPMA